MNQSTKVLTLVTVLVSTLGILAQLPYAVYSQNDSNSSNSEGIGGVTDPCERDPESSECRQNIVSNSTSQNTTNATEMRIDEPFTDPPCPEKGGCQ